MSHYKTRQKEALLNYLMSAPGEHVTAGDICEHFRSSGNPIGTATVYRNLETLVTEGIVNKYLIDGMSPACYEYAGDESHAADVCFHCKCERCGTLIHLHCSELEAIGAHISQRHGFTISPIRTVFYGVCDACRSSEDGDLRA